MSNKKNLLFVDDEYINLMLFEINFEEKYNVYTALSGADGLLRLKSNPEIEVVICDMKMPVMGGLEFIRLAKKEYPQIVFMVLSGIDVNEQMMKALKDKLVYKCLSKPVNMKAIETAIVDSLK